LKLWTDEKFVLLLNCDMRNAVITILQHGLLKNDENEEIINVDSIEVEAFEEDSTCLLH